MTQENRTLAVQGLEVAYRRSGTGAPLLYLHGVGTSVMWLPLHDALAGTFDVIAPDHPGFGGTARPDWLTDFSDLVVHYAALLDTLGTGPVHLVGHGLGGWIAAEIAAFYPERLASLTLIAPAGLRPQPDERCPDVFRMEGEDRGRAWLGEDFDRWRALLEPLNPFDQKLRDYHESIAEALISWNPRYDIKLDRRLARVNVPALVLLPQNERYLPASVGARFATVLPNAQLRTITGTVAETEHMMVLQEPDAIAAAICELAPATQPA